MQYLIDKKRQNIRYKTEFEDTPLKNFLKCGTCGTAFAGYVVKKKGLFYYKCNKNGCKCNRNAKTLNLMFMDFLEDYRSLEIYLEPIKEEFMNYVIKITDGNRENEKLFKTQLTEIKKKTEALEEKFILEDINKELYDKFLLKYRTEKKNIQDNLDNCRVDLSNLEKQGSKYVEMCVKLPSLWDKASFNKKMELQNLVFPEGIYYDREKNNYRTTKVNAVILFISRLSKVLEDGVKKKTALLGGLSSLVGTTGFEPVTLCL